MEAIRVENLWVRYGKTTAVQNLSFTIGQGELFGFIGPNGAGKTTTIRVLATLLRPDFGTAYINGMDVARDPRQVRTKIGYMPDFFGVYDDLTVNEYLHFFAAAHGLERAKRKSVVGDVLTLTDLADKKNDPVDALSRGMKQRLGVARVLLHDPDVLLLDEPASGLDPRARIEIREILKELRNMGKTILVSSHILHELSQLCTSIGIIEARKLVAQGPLDEIYRQLQLLRVVHVQINNLTEDLVQQIRALPGVTAVEESLGRLAIDIREEELEPAELLSRLHGLGCRIHMFQPEAMDMETVFMKLTEGKTA